jgi:hypothetical protein
LHGDKLWFFKPSRIAMFIFACLSNCQIGFCEFLTDIALGVDIGINATAPRSIRCGDRSAWSAVKPRPHHLRHAARVVAVRTPEGFISCVSAHTRLVKCNDAV